MRRFYGAKDNALTLNQKIAVNHRLFIGYVLSFGLFFVGCHSEQRLEGSKEAVDKIKSMQIKRVTPQQIVAIVDDWGARIVKQAQASWDAAQRQSPKGELTQLCKLEGVKKIDSLEALYGVQIMLLGQKDVKNPNLSSKEQEVMDAYVYNAENKISQITNIQKLGDSVLIYTSPIPQDHMICKECFKDDATHLGIWRIKFLKNEVVRKVDAKSLEKKKK